MDNCLKQKKEFLSTNNPLIIQNSYRIIFLSNFLILLNYFKIYLIFKDIIKLLLFFYINAFNKNQ